MNPLDAPTSVKCQQPTELLVPVGLSLPTVGWGWGWGWGVGGGVLAMLLFNLHQQGSCRRNQRTEWKELSQGQRGEWPTQGYQHQVAISAQHLMKVLAFEPSHPNRWQATDERNSGNFPKSAQVWLPLAGAPGGEDKREKGIKGSFFLKREVDLSRDRSEEG